MSSFLVGIPAWAGLPVWNPDAGRPLSSAGSPLRRANLIAISLIKVNKETRFLDEVSWKLVCVCVCETVCVCVCVCVDGLTLWTGGHLHIRCDSHYFMFFSANCASQHSSMFSSICLLSIDQPSRASVCLTSATSSSSSGNYAASLHLLLISVSTCGNICFGMSFVSANSLGFFFFLHALSTFAHSHKEASLLSACSNECLRYSNNEEEINHCTQSR